jgi:hypothetical protein
MLASFRGGRSRYCVAFGLVIDQQLIVAMTWSVKTSRRTIELGFLSGVIGGVIVALSFGRRTALLVGGLLVALGFGLAILAVHFGQDPFRR